MKKVYTERYRSGFAPILIVLIILGSVFVGVGGFFAYQKHQTKKAADAFKDDAPTAPNLPTGNNSPPPNHKSDETANWKTYENKAEGYSIKYPNDWHFYDANTLCKHRPTLVIISDPKNEPIKNCYQGDLLPPAFYIETQNTTKLPESNEYDTYNPIEIAGINGVKNIKTATSELPRGLDTRIYLINNNQTCYLSYPNTDENGNHEKIYDQILSTFKFTQ